MAKGDRKDYLYLREFAETAGWRHIGTFVVDKRRKLRMYRRGEKEFCAFNTDSFSPKLSLTLIPYKGSLDKVLKLLA